MSRYTAINIIGCAAAVLLFIGVFIILFADSGPQIVVNMPKDGLPLEQLATPVISSDAKVITQERAVLWWTVFSKMADKGYTSSAADIADRAVNTVYGPAPKQ